MPDSGTNPVTQPPMHWVRLIGLIAGPLLAVGCFFILPETFVASDGTTVQFSIAGRKTLAVLIWMGTWWLTEAIDISATALLPPVAFPFLGVASAKEAAAPYGSDIIFLFMGGFLLALSMQRWRLDRRIALLTLRIVGTSPANMVGGFMVATAMLSAFVSNTATAAMMLPIALSVIALIAPISHSEERSEANANQQPNHFGLCLMLGIAYAASIGGIATTIGSPPNGFAVEFIRESIDPTFQREISFVQWMMIGLPIAIVFLPITWFILTKLVYPIKITSIHSGQSLLQDHWRALGRISRGEWITFIVFSVTALLWMIRPILNALSIETDNGATWQPLQHVRDSTIAMLGGLILFVIPINVRSRTFTMNWQTARQLPWGILILFGGGLSLAAAVEANGVAEFIASRTSGLHGIPPLLIVTTVVAVVIFLSELTSNTATTTTLVPIFAALAPGLGIHPYLLIVPAAIAASCAFMMPVATPPNAIVFASNRVTIPQMCHAGLWLNLVGIVIVTLIGYTLIAWWLI